MANVTQGLVKGRNLSSMLRGITAALCGIGISALGGRFVPNHRLGAVHLNNIRGPANIALDLLLMPSLFLDLLGRDHTMSKAHLDPEFAPQQDVPMKVRLGNLTIVVAVLFGLGLFISMGRAAWYPPPWQNSLIAFFAFGIPMIVLGVATHALWENEDELKVRFGWACVAAGLVWALALFGFIAEWVGITSFRREPVAFIEGLVLFLGFAVPTLICGGPGIALVMESDK